MEKGVKCDDPHCAFFPAFLLRPPLGPNILLGSVIKRTIYLNEKKFMTVGFALWRCYAAWAGKLVTEVSRQPTGLIFKGQAVTSQKSEDRNYTAPEARDL